MEATSKIRLFSKPQALRYRPRNVWLGRTDLASNQMIGKVYDTAVLSVIQILTNVQGASSGSGQF